MITPAFHFDILDKTLGTMIKHTNVAIDKFEAFAEREVYVDIWEELSLLGFDICFLLKGSSYYSGQI